MTMLTKTGIWRGITEGVEFDGLRCISFFVKAGLYVVLMALHGLSQGPKCR